MTDAKIVLVIVAILLVAVGTPVGYAMAVAPGGVPGPTHAEACHLGYLPPQDCNYGLVDLGPDAPADAVEAGVANP